MEVVYQREGAWVRPQGSRCRGRAQEAGHQKQGAGDRVQVRGYWI